MRKAARSGGTARSAKIRCAVYTRKSSEEGLEQAFNSLDAQRDACEAYIASQKHEGWTCLPEMYDDGGISGATMDRPALKRLLADIEAGRVDTVVVYKVDRLTRSLGDFAKIVEVFDARSVSFVSVTQQFNTTTSMGRLTLNMLLSFAQFEREVTGERIRDKIAASKRKGMWMGGLPPLGYDVGDRELVVNGAEAETVRHIFRRYVALASVRGLQGELERDGIVSKARVDRYGRKTGGKPLARGALYWMLRNRVYRGEIVHKESSYPGRHQAIVDQALWDATQRTLADNWHERAPGNGRSAPSLLAGLVHDEAGDRMTPSHASKQGRRYRYYVSHGLVRGRRSDAPRGRRVPAGDLEGLVEDRLRSFLGDEAGILDALGGAVPEVSEAMAIVARTRDLATGWPGFAPTERRTILATLVERVDLLRETVEIRIVPGRLPALMDDGPSRPKRALSADHHAPSLTLSIPARLKRTGKETRLLIQGAGTRRKPDHSLHRLLAQAHRYRNMLMSNTGKSIAALAAEAGVGGPYFSRVLRLGFLAPDIVAAILQDRHPIELTAKHLMAMGGRLPAAWDDQHALLGIE